MKALNGKIQLQSLRLEDFFKLVFTFSDNKVIDVNSSYGKYHELNINSAILEDLFESQPVHEIETIFSLLENQVANHKTVSQSKSFSIRMNSISRPN